MAERFARAMIVAALVCLSHAGVCIAHSLAPSLLALAEVGDDEVDVTWKTPLLRVPGSDLRPALPADCTVATPPTLSEEDASVTARWRVACAGGGLVGREIGVEDLAAAKTDALLHVTLADGRVIQTVLRAREPTFVIPDRERGPTVARRYVELGIDHIVTGYDHLLFVLGLLLLVRGGRALVATITAFTVGHSVTLSLAVLGLARLASAPVETLIAASIFVLATELARPESTSPMWRRPWLVAASFGLLHGLGFAGALREAGLPADAIPIALLSFNVGIEVGQLAFVALALLAHRTMRVLSLPAPAWARTIAVYAIGSLAAFWVIERALPMLPGVG
jgi:hydrogenase/urease accessory protein HupE